MNAPQLAVGRNASTAFLVCSALALAIVGSGCHRPAAKEDLKQSASAAAAQIKTQSAEARDRFSDAWITTKIQSKLVGDREIHARDIDVSTHDGVVTLKGHVLNEPLRQLAVALAMNTEGVKQVVNQLDTQVAPPAPVRAQNGATPGAVATSGAAASSAPVTPTTNDSSDARIATAIQSKYFLDDRIKGRHINVTSSSGVVTLNGEVADETERAQALLLARTTDGVTRVEDGLTVAAAAAPDATPSSAAAAPAAGPVAPGGDETLSTRVQSQLSADARIKGAPIEVTAKNGVVLLQGTVGSAAVKQRALALARGTDGVTQVVDRIRVGKAKR
jgi:osmotically-inducible protein OsmY